jgi:hypothetical protein
VEDPFRGSTHYFKGIAPLPKEGKTFTFKINEK